ncbi:MAG: ABC transporter permease [Alphaproteobacteria bacterium]|nr:ABC transporter permease [Alphaproteobacteria bacterium]
MAPPSASLAQGVAGGGVRAALLRAWDSDIAASFRSSWVTMAAAVLTLLFCLAALFGPPLLPTDPFDPATINLMDAFTPPVWHAEGSWRYLLGVDHQGRDILSAIVYGLRTSLGVGLAAVLLAMVSGVAVGLLSGYVGGALDAFIMRVADIQLSFPAILVALIVDGLLRGLLPRQTHADLGLIVVILAIAASNWVRFARTVRGSTMVERRKEYVQAAQLVGRGPVAIAVAHILPNISSPILVIATIDLGIAILQEATLSFLGVGMPPDQPSLGSLVEHGRNYLLSGEYWMALFPGAVLALLVLAVNLLGDWLRDVFNPKLR